MRSELFSKEDSYLLRGIAICMVIASHYGAWCAPLLRPEVSRMMSKLGDYGVDIFFLMSGYALAKTAAGKRMDLRFLGKRMKNMYLPYLLTAGLVELIAGGEVTGARIAGYLLGREYWFISNILVFYLMFFVLWRIGSAEGKESAGLLAGAVRAAALCAAVVWYSRYLYLDGRQDFWYVSNAAFLVGILAGQFEKELLRAKKWWQPIGLALLTVLMAGVCYGGMREDVWLTEEQVAPAQIAANMIWTLLVLCLPGLAGAFGAAGRILRFLGRISLYLYLSHTCVYYQTITYVDARQGRQNGTALALTVLTAWLLSALMDGAFRAAGKIKGKIEGR